MEKTMTEKISVKEVLDKVQEIAPVIKKYSAEAEDKRQLSSPVVEAIKHAGLFSLWVPEKFGGQQMEPVSTFKILEEIAKLDSAVSWNLQISNAINSFLAWLPKEGIQEVYAKGPDLVFAGALFPPGQAIPVEGGYRFSGRWPFVSGCQFADWYMATSIIMDGEEMRMAENGQPIQMIMIFSREDTEIIENWDTLGMRGTGSHDIGANEIFVPERRTAMIRPLENFEDAFNNALYRMTIWPPIAALAPPAIGIAQTAIDEMIELAKNKTPAFTTTVLRNRKDAQSAVAEAQALLSAGRAYLYEALHDGWQHAEKGQVLDIDHKMKIKMATIFSIRAAADAVDKIHTIAGASGIRNEYRFQRHFRDVHTITQHAHASVSRYQSVGNLMFGNEIDWPFFAL